MLPLDVLDALGDPDIVRELDAVPEAVGVPDGVSVPLDDWLGDGEQAVLRPNMRTPRYLEADVHVAPASKDSSGPVAKAKPATGR